MELLQTFLSEHTIQRIGWVLVHFLWQGVAAGALLWCMLKMLSKASSHTRYIAACVGLALMVLAPAVTFMVLNDDAPVAVAETPVEPLAMSNTPMPAETRVITIDDAQPEPIVLPEPSLTETFMVRLEAALPYCVVGWFFGVAILSVWYLGGWCQLQKLRRIGTKAVTDCVEANASLLAQRLGIRRAVGIVESALVQVPTVIGWLKPVILLPATALTGLDEIQLTAMIAHELAHIKRCDYLVNIVQTIVEVLGFYHPAVWWASRQIRIERESCCDDMAVAIVQNRKQYAGALFTMEAIRSKQLDLAVAANGGHLSSRISRLAGKPANHQKSGWIPSVITVLLIAVLLITTSMAMSNKINEQEQNPVTETGSTLEFRLVADMTPEQAEGIDGVNRNLVGYEWLPLKNPSENTWYKNMPHRQVDGKVDLLVSNQASETILADGSWGLEKTKLGNDNVGHPAVNVVFDEAGKDKFYELTKNHIGRKLAICVDGQVNSAPQIMTAIRSAAIITGKFTKEEAQALAEALAEGMPIVSLEEQPDSETFNDAESVSAYEKLSMSEEALPPEVINIWKILEKFIHSGVDNDYGQYEKCVTQRMKNGQDGTFADLVKMMQLNPDWKLALLSVFWDSEAALAVTDRLNVGDSQVNEPQTLVFTLEKGKDAWLISDIDLEVLNGLQIENARFSNNHPNADTWFIEPGPKNILSRSGGDTKFLLPSIRMVLDLSTGKLIDVPAENESQAECLEYIRQNCGCGIMFDHDGDVSHLGFINIAGVNRPTKAQFGIEMMSFASKNVPQEIVVTASNGNQYHIRILKAENEGCQLEFEQVNLETPQDEVKERMDNLKQLGLACIMFIEDNDYNVANTLDELKPYMEEDVYSWILENAVLLRIWGDFRDIRMPQKTPVAYDKTFLQQYGRRIVVFADGHVEIDKNDGLKELLDKAIQQAADVSQVLTKAYVVDVPADMPELKGIVPQEGAAQGEMITPEQLEVFLAAVRANPKARILAKPNILTNDNMDGSIITGDEADNSQNAEFTKLGIKHRISKDGKSTRMSVLVGHTQWIDGGKSTRSAATMAKIPFGHAFAISGMSSGDHKELFLIQPTIWEKQPSVHSFPASVEKVESPPAMGGGFGGGMTGFGGGMGGGMGGVMNGGMGGGMYEGERPEAGIEKSPSILDEVIDLSILTADMSVEEAIDVMRQSTDPPLSVIVLWGDLSNNAFIEKDSPIQVDGLGTMKLSAGLRAILRSLSAAMSIPIDFVVEDGVITIGTKEALSSMNVNGADKDHIQYPSNWDEISAERARRSGSMMMGGVREIESSILDEVIDFSPITTDMSLEEAIDLIRTSTDPPLSIIVLWGDLSENAFVEKDSPIEVDGLGDMKLSAGLRAILRSVSSTGFAVVGYVVEDGVITIGTEESLPEKMRTVVYDVADLLRPPSMNFQPSIGSRLGGGMGGYSGGGMGETAPEYSEQVQNKMKQLTQMLQSFVPESWHGNGGDGTIDFYGTRKLIIYQTPQVHQQIKECLEKLREELSKQVAIETRFLLVPDNFLEDIGLDTSLKAGNETAGEIGEVIIGPANSEEILAALGPKPLAEHQLPPLEASKQKDQTLDDLQMEFILRAAQAHTNVKQLTAPKVMVLNGESASIRLFTERKNKEFSGAFLDDPLNRDAQIPFIDIDGKEKAVSPGIIFEIKPVMTADQRYVILMGHVQFSEVLENQIIESGGKEYEIPLMQVANIPIPRVTVENEATVQITGPELRVKQDEEATSTEKQRLLILIKPTIIIPHEQPPEEAIGALAPRRGVPA